MEEVGSWQSAVLERVSPEEEGHAGLAGDGSCQESLAGAGRPGQQDALGQLSPQAGEPVGMLEELDDLGHLCLGLIAAPHVLEGLDRLLRQNLLRTPSSSRISECVRLAT